MLAWAAVGNGMHGDAVVVRAENERFDRPDQGRPREAGDATGQAIGSPRTGVEVLSL